VEFDNKILDYLHDAQLLVASYSACHNGLKNVALRIKFDDECGVDEWNGRTIELLFRDTLVVKGQLLGHVLGDVYIDSIFFESPPATTSIISGMVLDGIKQPKMSIAIVLNCGSEIFIACEHIEIKGN